MTRTFHGLALAVVVALALSGCSDKIDSTNSSTTDRPTLEVTAQPQDPQSARVAAEQLFDNLSDSDWAGAWELWTDSARAVIGKDAYVELAPTCTRQQGDYEVTDATPVDDSTVTIKWKRTPASGAAVAGTSTMRYQAGAWRYEPDAAAMTAYKQNKCP